MNAGAYGFSISDVMTEIVVYDEDGERQQPPEGWRFHYRGSSIPEGSAVARDHGAAPAGRSRRSSRRRRGSCRGSARRASRADATRAASSRTPRAATPAGSSTSWGSRARGAAAPWSRERHANFVVNDRGAKAQDVLDLLDLVHERVLREAGVDLELEVKVWRPRA